MQRQDTPGRQVQPAASPGLGALHLPGSTPAISVAVTASPEGFPPQDLRSFLELCAGEWLALRSHFDLGLVEQESPAAATTVPEAAAGDAQPGAAAVQAAVPADGGTEASQADSDGLPDFAALLQQARAEVEEAPSEEAWHSSERAELQVAFLVPDQADQPGGLRITPPQGGSRELYFHADGSFAGGADPDPISAGQWQLWPDGSLELILAAPGRVLRERIWFTQPNLRLRSSVEHGEDGVPGRARFSSEIRRVRKPAA